VEGKNMIWYSVIIIKKDSFESQIMDERHFGSYIEADAFASTYSDNNELATIIMKM